MALKVIVKNIVKIVNMDYGPECNGSNAESLDQEGISQPDNIRIEKTPIFPNDT